MAQGLACCWPSGLGGTFPPGYPVGVVEKVTGDSGQPFLTITATPAAALNRIREVLLIWPDPTGTVATAQDQDADATENILDEESVTEDAAFETPTEDGGATPALSAEERESQLMIEATCDVLGKYA